MCAPFSYSLLFRIAKWTFLAFLLANLPGRPFGSVFAQDEDDTTEALAKKLAFEDREKLSQKVTELAAKLDDVKKSVRDAAEADLIKIGPSAMEFLPASNDKQSDELNMRMDRLREVMGKLEMEQLTKPSVVTLSGSMTGGEALMELEKQTKNKIDLGGNENLDRMVDTEFQNTPFWEAFDEILDQMDLTVPGGDGNSLVLIPRPRASPLRIASAGYSGVFRVEPLTVQKFLSLQDPSNSSLQIQLLLSWEPRLTPVFVQFPMEFMNLICDDGQVLKMKVEAQETEFVPSGGCQMLVTLNLELPTREASRIKKWSGKVSVAIPGTPASVDFSDLMSKENSKERKSASVGNLTVILEKARKNRDIYEVLIGVRLKGTEKSTESFRGWSNLNEVYLIDSAGKRVEHAGWSTTRMGDDEIGLSYLFDQEKGLDGCTFVYRAPTNLIDQTFEFELEDVQLP
jgi:hypothetical protein